MFHVSTLRNLQSLVPLVILYNDDSFKIISPFFEQFFTLTSHKAVTPCCGIYSVARQEDKTGTHPQLLGKIWEL